MTTTADQHPEDAIDRALRGALGPGERELLDQHVAACSACAAHLKHAPRFQAELAAPPRAELADRRAVEGALARVRSSAGGRRRTVPLWMRAAAAGLLLAGGGVAAALLGKASPAPAPASAPVPSLAVEAPTVARPAVVPAEVAPAAVVPPQASSTAIATVSAEILFRRAGELRRQGRAAAAIDVYRRLQRSHPQTREAQLSFALTGQLLLDSGRSSEALSQFDRYLATGSHVDEEALAGRASALERLGRTADAAAAWKRLVEQHPDSVYAERARTRMQRMLPERR